MTKSHIIVHSIAAAVLFTAFATPQSAAKTWLVIKEHKTAPAIYLFDKCPDSPRQLFAPTLAKFEKEDQTHETPPVSFSRITSEILFGSICGLAGVLVGGAGGLALAGDESGESETYGAIFIGALAGWSVGNALGIYVVGSAEDQAGSFPMTLLGSAAGAAIVVMSIAALDPDHPAFLVAAASLPLAGGIVGFNLTRR